MLEFFETSGKEVRRPHTMSTADAGVPRAEYPVPGPPGASSVKFMKTLASSLVIILSVSSELNAATSQYFLLPFIPRFSTLFEGRFAIWVALAKDAAPAFVNIEFSFGNSFNVILSGPQWLPGVGIDTFSNQLAPSFLFGLLLCLKLLNSQWQERLYFCKCLF